MSLRKVRFEEKVSDNPLLIFQVAVYQPLSSIIKAHFRAFDKDV